MSKLNITSGEWYMQKHDHVLQVNTSRIRGTHRICTMGIQDCKVDDAQAIVTAVNSTYKKGLDPEAYEGVVKALERAQEMILGLGQREKFITKELKKARING